MVACLEKTEGNSKFHEIVDFFTSGMTHHALTRVKVQEHPLNPNLHPFLLTLVQETNPLVLALETVKDAQALEIIALKSRIKKLEKKCKPSISYHRAWLKSVQRLSMKKRFGKKESVSKHGRKKDKKDKPKPTLDDSTFDADLDADYGMDYMDTEEPVNDGRLSEETKELVSTARPEDIIVRPDVGTADPIAPPPTTSIFDDEDITMAQTLIMIKEEKAKEKGCVLEEPEPPKKMTRSDLDAAQIAKDFDVAIEKMYDEVQAGIEAVEMFAAKLQQEEREEYTIEERAKVIDDFKPMDSDDAVDKEKVLKEPDITKIEVKQEGDKESIRKRPGIRLKIKDTKKSKWKKIDSDLKEEEYDRMDIKKLYNLVMQRFETTSPEERRYPLTKETLERMLALRLIAESKSEAVFDLLRFIQKQIDKFGSYDGSEKDLKDLASPKQMTLGKDISNPLVVDKFTQNYMVISARCYCNEALAISEKTATGKETSNLFMAGSLPKTT
nr:hypothetical protein [Tanacetum cinerariifolium]